LGDASQSASWGKKKTRRKGGVFPHEEIVQPESNVFQHLRKVGGTSRGVFGELKPTNRFSKAKDVDRIDGRKIEQQRDSRKSFFLDGKKGHRPERAPSQRDGKREEKSKASTHSVKGGGDQNQKNAQRTKTLGEKKENGASLLLIQWVAVRNDSNNQSRKP